MVGNLRPLSTTERLDWLRLYRSQNVGPATFFRLLQRFGSAAEALAALPDLARQGGSRQPPRPWPLAAAERELDTLDRLGGRLLTACDPDFPALLRPLETAPLLTVLGNPALLLRPTVAVVGARNASLVGRRLARSLAAELAAAGVVVVSGLARGIDTAAHQGALMAGTAAVLAGGVDVVYPPENDELHRRIATEGCLVSEMPPGTQPQASHFPRRNRLISGLSLGVLVVEAMLHSGSLITARLALDQGREVFAVPGSPLDPRSQGTNRLIKDGAALVETAADVLDGLGQLAECRTPSPPPNTAADIALPNDDDLARARNLILPALTPAPVTVDEIVRQCQLSPAVVSMVLVEIELAGRLERHPGQQVSLLP